MDDLISKKEVEKAIEDVLKKWGYGTTMREKGYMSYDILQALDSIQPKNNIKR